MQKIFQPNMLFLYKHMEIGILKIYIFDNCLYLYNDKAYRKLKVNKTKAGTSFVIASDTNKIQ